MVRTIPERPSALWKATDNSQAPVLGEQKRFERATPPF